MNIIIIGAGFTGAALAKRLVSELNNVTLIDENDEILRHLSSTIDCATMCAPGNNIATLEEAGIRKADALVCITGNDEVNMITCSLVDSVYPRIKKIARVRNDAYYATANTKFCGIDHLVRPDVEAASAICKAVATGAISNIISFEGSNRQISRIPVTSQSVIAGRKLMELRSLTSIPMLVVYMEEDGVTTLPTGSTVINAGSFIGVISDKKDVGDIIALCGTQTKKLRKIAIVGSGRIGSLIATNLLSTREKLKIAIIDNDEAKAKKASKAFPQADVYFGDATDESFLNEEGITKYDLVICATHNHELNMVLAAFMESLGVGQSMALVTSGPFATIATKLGVDVSVSLRDVVVDTIMSHLRGKQVLNLHTLNEGSLEIIECVLSVNAKVCGSKVRDLGEHGKYLILLVKHRNPNPTLNSPPSDYELVNGQTVITAGDNLVLITKSDYSRTVLQMFQ